MINKVVGDTIIFEANLKDSDGTAITGAAAALTIVDAYGSTVYNSVAGHTSDGTYQHSLETTGWGYGPIVETWRFTSSGGTSTEVLTNTFRITGSTPNLTYISASELKTYFENVTDYFDGSEDENVLNACTFVNNQLNTLGHKTPVQMGTDGFYDQALRDWNAWEALARIVGARAVSQARDSEDKPWFDYFKKRADEKWEQFRSKRIVLNKQSSPAEVGILAGTKVAGTRFGQMETNWEGFGNGFQGEDFPRTWRIEILGTGTAGEVGEGTYRWSRDNGVTWEGTLQTAQAWTHLMDEVYVRFHRGTTTGTTGLYTTSDVWQFNTAPIKISTGGKYIARSY